MRGFAMIAAFVLPPVLETAVYGGGPSVAPRPARVLLAQAIDRSLPLLQKSAAAYIERRDCFSCHHQALPAFTVALAKRRGFDVDSKSAREQSSFTAEYFAARRERLVKGQGVPGGPFTAGYALMSLHHDGWKADATTAALVTYLLKRQRKDGGWKIGTDRPPLESSHFTATALSVRGLQLSGDEHRRSEIAIRTARAKAWLVKTRPRTQEDAAFHLLGLKWAGAGAEPIRAAVKQVMGRQRRDGGWGQLAGMNSDAYATGQTLAALHLAGGVAASHPVYRRGVRFLLKTQLRDGSWLVRTRSRPIQKYFESDYPHGKSQFISISGASWATTALLLAAPAID